MSSLETSGGGMSRNTGHLLSQVPPQQRVHFRRLVKSNIFASIKKHSMFNQLTNNQLTNNQLTSAITVNWKLHLQEVREMLPYYAAAEHKMYAIATWKICKNFQRQIQILICSLLEGLHAIRRSDISWTGYGRLTIGQGII